MKLFFVLVCTLLFPIFSFSKELCIKNDKGIFCGVEVTVEEKNNNKPQKKRECVEFKGSKFCGYDCKKTIFGADCKREKDEKCIDNINGVICGYNCKESITVSGCASKPFYECVIRFGEVKCGTDCRSKYGNLECGEDDPNAKYIK